MSRRPPGGTRRAEAFTLVELLVVIAVIGVLLTLVTPRLGNALQRARLASCTSNLRQIYMRLTPYLGRTGVFPDLLNRNTRSEPVPTLDTEFEDAGSRNLIYRCPSDRAGIFEESGCSYFWNFLANGQSPDRLRILGRTLPGQSVPLVADKEGFHPMLDDRVNVLYADGHVAPGLRDFFSTAP